jgi:hypothetical protein
MIFLLPMIIAVASAMHGYGRVDKIYPTLALCIILPLMLFIDGAGWWSLAGVLLAWFWRVCLRGGSQAMAELKAMDTITLQNKGYSNKERIKMVWKAHYYNPFGWLLGWLIVQHLTYDNVPYKSGDSYGKRFWDTRRRIETLSGALPQASVLILIYAIIVYML